MSRRLFLQVAGLAALIALVNSCRERTAPGTGTLTGKIIITEHYGLVYKPENMPIYLLGKVELLDKEHEALGNKVRAELDGKSAINAKSERLGVKKYVQIANMLFFEHLVKEGKTDSKGRFKITRIPPGRYRLLFSYSVLGSDPYSSLTANRHYHWFFDIEIKAGEILNLDLNKYNARGMPYWDII
ncbi:MAG: hypothetical protein P9M00_11300 [Candidatus Tritonobacter lacicola]|nr:hypothetical protein [Candidatus Tritonobacter lacicola]